MLLLFSYCCSHAAFEQVVDHGGLIDGINFDIENLKSVQNEALYRTVAALRNQVFRNYQPPLGASFDVIERGPFHSAVLPSLTAPSQLMLLSTDW